MIKTDIQILKSAHEVYEAIVDPAKMSGYFIAKGSGRLEDGKTVTWSFPEFDFEFPVRVVKTEIDRFVSFHWDAEDGKELLVEITLAPRSAMATVVTVTEKKMENNEAGIKWLAQNTAGWAGFLACLKAYLEYGINLRKGAYDHLSDNK